MAPRPRPLFGGPRALAAAIVAAALAVAGCGAPSSGSPNPGASAVAPAASPIATPLPRGSFSFDLPAGFGGKFPEEPVGAPIGPEPVI